MPYISKQDNSFKFLEKLLQDAEDWINFVYEQRYTSVNTYLSRFSSRLEAYKKTNNYELYSKRLRETDTVFNKILELNIIDIDYECQEIRKMLFDLEIGKNWAGSTYLSRQTKINKLRKSVLGKLENLKG